MRQIDLQKTLCEELAKVKKRNPNNYEKILDVLRFIYKEVLTKYRYNGKEISIGFCEEHIGKNVYDLTEKENGIIDNLIDMCQNEDDRFCDKFFSAIQIPLDLFERNVSRDTRDYLYVINLYAMLKAYQYNKDDFENFEEIVNDTAFQFVHDSSTLINRVENFSEVIKIIEGYVSNPRYKEVKLLSDSYKKFIYDIQKNKNFKDIERLQEMFKMFRDFECHLKNENRNQRKVSKDLEKEIVEDIALLVHPDLLPGVYPYYSRILIYNNRYRYFKENIKVVSSNYQKEVFNTVKKLNIGMFAEINKTSDRDSFETYMDILFDSDTNTELLNKMRMLEMASEKYSSGDTDGALLTLSALDSDINKERHGDIVVEFPKENTINKVSKPKTINERMEILYREKDLIRDEFSLTEKRKSLEEFKRQVLEEMTHYSTIKFSKRQFEDDSKDTFESMIDPMNVYESINVPESKKPEPVKEMKLGVFGNWKVKR